MTREAIDFAADWLDAINVDLKAFSDDYYRNLCGARLQPVLDCDHLHRQSTRRSGWRSRRCCCRGRTIPRRNSRSWPTSWSKEAGPDVPWHISRFYPQYKYTDSEPTPLETMQRAEEIGKAAGLHYVYLGNVPGDEMARTPICYSCGRMLIERMGYRIVANQIKNSKCPQCGTEIAGFGL